MQQTRGFLVFLSVCHRSTCVADNVQPRRFFLPRGKRRRPVEELWPNATSRWCKRFLGTIGNRSRVSFERESCDTGKQQRHSRVLITLARHVRLVFFYREPSVSPCMEKIDSIFDSSGIFWDYTSFVFYVIYWDSFFLSFFLSVFTSRICEDEKLFLRSRVIFGIVVFFRFYYGVCLKMICISCNYQY